MQVGLRRPPFLSSLTFLNFEQTLYPGVSMMSISFYKQQQQQILLKIGK